MGEIISDKAIEDGAKAVHEALLGADTWLRASANERSRSRHAVRLVIAALSKNGAPVKLAPVKAEATVPKAPRRPEPAAPKKVAAFKAHGFKDDRW